MSKKYITFLTRSPNSDIMQLLRPMEHGRFFFGAVVPQLHIVAGMTPSISRINVRSVGLSNHGNTNRGCFAMLGTCEFCGKEFSRCPSKFRIGKRAYCSEKCASASQIRSVEQICETCGKQAIISSYLRTVRRGRYCSDECMHKAEEKRAQDSWQNRFWSRVQKTDDCWFWIGGIDTGGYGTLSTSNGTVHAHRLSYILHCGPIPDGLHVCHSCDINYPQKDLTYRRCVRPDHLFLGTNMDNRRDSVTKQRQARGSGHGIAKLKEEDIIQIRYLVGQGISHRIVAKMFGIHRTNVGLIIQGKAWRHV